MRDAVSKQSLDLHEVSVTVIVAVRPPDIVIVDDQAVIREITIRHAVAPLKEIVLIEELRAAVLESLVRDLKRRQILRVVLCDLAETLLELRLVLLDRRVVQPVRKPRVVVQAVALRLDALLLAVLDAEVGRGAAVDLRRILRESRLALLRLKVAPVERHGSEIEQLGELLAVDPVLLLALELVEHEYVRAELELVVLLLDLDGYVLGEVLALYVYVRAALAVELDAGLDLEVHNVLLLVEVPERGISSCHFSVSFSGFTYSIIRTDGLKPLYHTF